MIKFVKAATPLGRLADPDEIAAAAALFLASDESSFVNGVELFVDGGRGADLNSVQHIFPSFGPAD